MNFIIFILVYNAFVYISVDTLLILLLYFYQPGNNADYTYFMLYYTTINLSTFEYDNNTKG